MSARTGPPGKVRPPGAESGGREDRQQAAASGTSVSTLQRPDDTTREPVHVSQCVAEFVNTLLDLGRSCGEIPLYGSPEWAELDRTDPRRFASVVAAAECWRQDGEPDRMRDRLLDELAVADLLARWRVRVAGLDVRHAIDDWPRVLDVVMARREVAA
jgi:hypothetical protein